MIMMSMVMAMMIMLTSRTVMNMILTIISTTKMMMLMTIVMAMMMMLTSQADTMAITEIALKLNLHFALGGEVEVTSRQSMLQ